LCGGIEAEEMSHGDFASENGNDDAVRGNR